MNTIPAFIDTRSLVIKQARSSQENGYTQELTAVDPQGDSITVNKWTEDTGATCVVPDEKLTVSYQENGKEPLKKDFIGEDEAYDLYRALRNAEEGENLDSMTVGFLIADLGRQGGAGGGACSL